MPRKSITTAGRKPVDYFGISPDIRAAGLEFRERLQDAIAHAQYWILTGCRTYISRVGDNPNENDLYRRQFKNSADDHLEALRRDLLDAEKSLTRALRDSAERSNAESSKAPQKSWPSNRNAKRPLTASEKVDKEYLDYAYAAHQKRAAKNNAKKKAK